MAAHLASQSADGCVIGFFQFRLGPVKANAGERGKLVLSPYPVEGLLVMPVSKSALIAVAAVASIVVSGLVSAGPASPAEAAIAEPVASSTTPMPTDTPPTPTPTPTRTPDVGDQVPDLAGMTVSKRTEFSTEYTGDDGEKVLHLSADPVSEKDDSGK